MKGEINSDFYCVDKKCGETTDCYCIGVNKNNDIIYSLCPNAHRKWPNPEQFKEEYGKEYPDDGAVYVKMCIVYSGVDDTPIYSWEYTKYKSAINTGISSKDICIACTPWGKPPDGWRPE